MNPYVWLGGCVLMAAALVGAYAGGRADGRKLEQYEQDRAAEAIRDARDALQAQVAEGLANIQVKNVTIKQQAETVVREVPVYRECKHAPEGLELVNQALTGIERDDGIRVGVDSGDH